MRAQRSAFKAAFVLLAFLAVVKIACAQTDSAPDPVFQMEFSHPALSPSHWTLSLHPDGSGHFHSERGNALGEKPQTLEAPNVDRDIRLSAGFVARVFAVARHRNWSKMECESPIKVAFMGMKRFSYSGPGGQGACQFNYSNDKEIQALGVALIGVAETILVGARLEMLLQHDRLGLDQEMEFLTEEAGEGRAQQIYLIQGILERLAGDPGVLDRVRKKAKVLLAKREQ